MATLPSPPLLHPRGRMRTWFQRFAGSMSALIYLRYRMRKNAWERDSVLGRVVTTMFFIVAILGAGFAWLIGGVAAYFVHRELDQNGWGLFWSISVVVFLLVWLIHFSSEIFRNDVLTLDRIMHLPIAPSQAFAINYVSSLINFPLVYFTGFCSGAIVGAAFALGPRMLLLFVSLAAYLALVTSLTSQFQGALAAWISNPRRRTTAMVLFSLFFIVVFPLLFLGIPKLIGYLEQPRTAARVVPKEPSPTPPAEPALTVEPAPPNRSKLNELSGAIAWSQVVFPPLWMAGCATSMAQGRWHVGWLTPLMVGLAVLSLHRNYRMTVRFYQDGFNTYVAEAGSESRLSSDRSRVTKAPTNWMESSLPWVSSTVSAIVMQTWLSMWRAPELKLMLLAPLLQPLMGLFLIRLWNGTEGEAFRTLVALGLAGFGLYTTSGILGNQFGLDRAGFRAWVLSPIPRWEILHGRNLALGIPAWCTAALMGLTVGIWWELPIDKLIFLLLTLASFVPFFLLVSDLMSILSPFGLPPGAIQPKEFSWKHIVINLLLSMLYPALLGWTALPFACEVGADLLFPGLRPWPIAMLMAVPWLVLSIGLYRSLLPWVGTCMAYWELEILKTVTSTLD